mmetsp:Transcript_85717/g.242757  ORF Transcript_85717/g.242757 Transcript_85717/m.242757 type:complete len:336 (+) Transcript_85717:2405-3412(+)
MSSTLSASMVLISCEVRKPSWKCTIGTRPLSVAMWATSARSWQSCTHWPDSMPQPVARAAITSWWSPKMDSASPARARAATWITQGMSSPAILYMFGIISSSPCEEVNVVPRPPAATEPWRAPAAPASDWSCWTLRRPPQMFLTPATDQASQISAMGDEGVIGKMKASSDIEYATWEQAVQPSQARTLCFATTAGSPMDVIEVRELMPGKRPPSAPVAACLWASACRNFDIFSSSSLVCCFCLCSDERACRRLASCSVALRICSSISWVLSAGFRSLRDDDTTRRFWPRSARPPRAGDLTTPVSMLSRAAGLLRERPRKKLRPKDGELRFGPKLP